MNEQEQIRYPIGIFRASGHLYEISALLFKSVRYTFKRPYYFDTILEQMNQIGVNSLSIVLLTSIFTGMVLALQTGYEMARFGSKMYVGSVVALSMIRELGPVLTALVVAGRVGSGITAELGSMQVTEQIDAMRALATNPIKKLVATRILATVVMLPFLTVVADTVGILGGFVISIANLNLNFEFYRYTVIDALTLTDLITGLIKPVVFGLIISLIGCYMGMTTKGGTRGVGRATTNSVVVSSILILASDFLLTKTFFLIFE